MHAHTHMCAQTHTPIYAYTHTSINIYVSCLCVCVYAYAYTHTDRKMLFKLFHDLEFKITVEMKKRRSYIIYLDVEFNLNASTVSPCMKLNTIGKYINYKSNHPSSIIKHILKGIECRLSRNILSKDIFESKNHY